MPRAIKPLLIIFCLSSLLIGCKGGETVEKTTPFPSIKDVPESDWKKLSEKRIFFGHQSVGINIIDGIKDTMKENSQIELNIVETSNSADFDAPLFAHSRVGENTDPQSKIDAFTNFTAKGIGGKADITFFKLCFADIIGTTDVNNIFNAYKNSMSHLKKTYPKTTLVHVTVPLLHTRKTFKIWIKRIIGKRDMWGYDGNIKRNNFNELVRNEYDGKEPLFDLASIESTYPDGRILSFSEDGKTYYSLVSDYTHEGGHLSELGRKVVAEQLLILLANLSK